MDDSIYVDLLKNAHTLKDAEKVDSCGMDSYLSDQIKVASLGDLSQFFRMSNDTLVHKAERDLWRIGEDKAGNVVIERLFDPTSNQPIKV
jgi:hypothetical protein